MAVVTDPTQPEVLADTLEALAWYQGSFSQAELVSHLRESHALSEAEAAAEGRGPHDGYGLSGAVEAHREALQRHAEEAFSRVGHREQAMRTSEHESCGLLADGYPFQLSESGQVLTHTRDGCGVYEFMLALSLTYDGSQRPLTAQDRKLFEEICACAAIRYLGAAGSSAGHAFGFPRRTLSAGFTQAFGELCHQAGEGGEYDSDRDSRHTKDDGVDVVAWGDFLDRELGKLVLIGGCATGANWKSKLGESGGGDRWWTDHARYQLAVPPVQAHFVPFLVTREDRRDARRFRTMIFDRFRIACFGELRDPELASKCDTWASELLGQVADP